MEIGPSQFMQLSVLGPILPPSRRGILTARTIKWEYCTNERNTFLVNWDGPMAMVPCLHQGNIYTKRKLRVWTDQKCIPLVGAIIPLTCAGRQNTPSRGRQYRAQNGKFGKLGRTYGHGTVFAPRKYLY